MSQNKSNDHQQQARQRTAVIMKVQSGQLTATQAAKQLGISRKTYYELEAKALAGMMQALNPGKSGRPKKPVDQQKQAMAKEIKELKQQVALNEMKINIRDLFKELDKSNEKRPSSEKKTK